MKESYDDTDVMVVQKLLDTITGISEPGLRKASQRWARALKFRVAVLKQNGHIRVDLMDPQRKVCMRTLEDRISKLSTVERLQLADYFTWLAMKIRTEVGETRL